MHAHDYTHAKSTNISIYISYTRGTEKGEAFMFQEERILQWETVVVMNQEK